MFLQKKNREYIIHFFSSKYNKEILDNVNVSFKSTDVQLLLWFTTFNQLTIFNSTDNCNQSTGLGCLFVFFYRFCFSFVSVTLIDE